MCNLMAFFTRNSFHRINFKHVIYKTIFSCLRYNLPPLSNISNSMLVQMENSRWRKAEYDQKIKEKSEYLQPVLQKEASTPLSGIAPQ